MSFYDDPDHPASLASSDVCDGDDMDEELQAAASHLNKGLSSINDEDEGDEEEHDKVGEEKRDTRMKRPSLEVLLGPLPTAASLGLSNSINMCVGEEKENGECHFCLNETELKYLGY